MTHYAAAKILAYARRWENMVPKWLGTGQSGAMKLEGLSILGQGRAKPVGQPTAALNAATGARLEPDYFWATAQEVDQSAQKAEAAFAEYRLWEPKRRAVL